jgi:hypothetical protein
MISSTERIKSGEHYTILETSANMSDSDTELPHSGKRKRLDFGVLLSNTGSTDPDFTIDDGGSRSNFWVALPGLQFELNGNPVKLFAFADINVPAGNIWPLVIASAIKFSSLLL